MISRALLAMTLAIAATSMARADLSLSNAKSKNITCVHNVCKPTAKGANLRISDLVKLLASADVTIKTGKGAVTIYIGDPLAWASSHRLTLQAEYNVSVHAPVTVQGTGGALTIDYATTNPDGDLKFLDSGKIDFWDISGSLIIQDDSYTLVEAIATLASDIAANPGGHYALANDIDESGKTYRGSLISTPLGGALTGLGHVIANLSIAVGKPSGAFIYQIDEGAITRDISFLNVSITKGKNDRGLHPGALVMENYGAIDNIFVTGQVYGDYFAGVVGKNERTGTIRNAIVSATITGAGRVGGIAGENDGTISYSAASGSLAGGLPNACTTPYTGGLTGVNGGTIVASLASNTIDGANGEYKKDGCEIFAKAGGLVGYNSGAIDQSFATGNVTAGDRSYVGGLAGYTDSSGSVSNTYSLGPAHATEFETRAGGFSGNNTGSIATSYAVGAPSGGDPNNDCQAGGFIGCDGAPAGSLSSDYWDLDTSGISDPSRGAGKPLNDPGIIGLTDAQLKFQLPNGFDPQIWGQSPSINNGYPYLLANPPPN